MGGGALADDAIGAVMSWLWSWREPSVEDQLRALGPDKSLARLRRALERVQNEAGVIVFLVGENDEGGSES